MADKQISELTQVGALDNDGLFVVQQAGAAYKATAEQVAGMSGGGGAGGGGTGGESAYILDLTGTVEVDSDPRTADERTQGFDLNIDVYDLLAAKGRIQMKYRDVRFDDQIHTATFEQKMVDDAAGEGDTYLMLYAPTVNPWWGVASAFELEIKVTPNGYAASLAYWPFAQEQADFEVTDNWLPGHIRNNPIKVQNGFAYIDNTPKPTAFNWSGLTCSVPMDDGSTHSIAINTDASGAVTGFTIDGLTVPITGVS